MKHVSQFLFIATLVLPTGLLASGCTEEIDDFEDMDELRPDRPICHHCVGELNAIKPKTKIGVTLDYDPADITNVSVIISNSGGTELRDYGDTLIVPNDPDLLEVIDSELCTVGSTGNPPTAWYVEFEITDAAGVHTVGNNIPFSGTCS